MAPDTETALSWMDISTYQFDMIPFYLGGAKTLIVPGKDNIASTKVFGKHNTLGIRIPNNEFCNNLSIKFDKPITSTSVNRTNKRPLNDPKLILNEFGDEIDLLIDGGTLPQSKGSTIYQLKNNKISILRN
jgi:L-threonylcarbamoyladenylate synthase